MSNAPYPSRLLRGELIFVSPADPAAGAPFDYILPAFYNYELLYMRWQLICSAAVASRYTFWQFFDPTGIEMVRGQTFYPQLTSQTRNYYSSQISNYNAAVYPNTLQAPIPIANLLAPNGSIGIAVDTMDAADQIHDVQITLIRHALPGN